MLRIFECTAFSWRRDSSWQTGYNHRLILTRTQSKKKHKHPEKESQYHYICKNIAFDYLNPTDISDEYLLKLRIVRVEVSVGVFENIITTLSEEDFTPDDIKYCYNLRWGIETSFRDLKHTIGATNLHSKKTEYVAFELWSKLILYNFCSIIILHVPVKSRNRKYEYQVNFSIAMKIFLNEDGFNLFCLPHPFHARCTQIH